MTVLARMREVAVHRRNNRSDWILLGTIVALSAFGLLMIYSATRSSGTFSMERQMVFVAAGLIIGFLSQFLADVDDRLIILPLFAWLAYGFVVVVGVWRAASRYAGLLLWSILARAAFTLLWCLYLAFSVWGAVDLLFSG